MYFRAKPKILETAKLLRANMTEAEKVALGKIKREANNGTEIQMTASDRYIYCGFLLS